MNANNVPIIDLKKESLINAFQNYMGRSFSNDKMLRFLSAYNATLLAMISTKKEFTKEEKETLYEFHDWFLEKYGEKTYKARMREWGQEPLIFRYTENLYMQDREKERKKLVEQATSEEIKEAKKFRDQLLRIHQDKILNCTDDVNSDVDVYHMPGAFAESEVKFMKSYFGEICLEALKNNGAIVVRVQGNEKKNDQLFGVFCTKGKFISVSKEAMLNAHCTRPDGTRMEPEKGLVYTTLEEVLRREK